MYYMLIKDVEIQVQQDLQHALMKYIEYLDFDQEEVNQDYVH